MESSSARVSLGEGGENGPQAYRSAMAIEDMFSACGKYRPHLPTRNAYRIIRGGRVARGVLRSRDFEDGKVAETSTMQAQCALLKRIRSLARGMASAGRPARSPAAAGYSRVARTCDGGADSRLPSRSGRPVRDIAGDARLRRQCRPSSLFPRLGESFRY
jgi:hypothetical protein